MSAEKPSMSRRIKDTSLGYDFYICYARQDAEAYARILKETLSQRGFKCFIDVESIEVGMDWRSVITESLRQSRTMILIGSPAAFASDYVRVELEAFRRSGTGRILPIIFDPRALHQADHLFWLQSIQWLQEDPLQLQRGPSDRAIAQITRALEYFRRDTPLTDVVARPVEEKRALNEGKLILVGRGEVGKTSVVNGLVHR